MTLPRTPQRKLRPREHVHRARLLAPFRRGRRVQLDPPRCRFCETKARESGATWISRLLKRMVVAVLDRTLRCITRCEVARRRVRDARSVSASRSHRMRRGGTGPCVGLAEGLVSLRGNTGGTYPPIAHLEGRGAWARGVQAQVATRLESPQTKADSSGSPTPGTAGVSALARTKRGGRRTPSAGRTCHSRDSQAENVVQRRGHSLGECRRRLREWS
jgi:hypothetical protein